MSNFFKLTRNPLTGQEEMAEWLDNYFGHKSGVRFSDGSIINEDYLGDQKFHTRDFEGLLDKK